MITVIKVIMLLSNRITLIVSLSGCLLCVRAHGQIITDSARDFSDTQGAHGWSYGLFKTPFTPATFELLPLYATNNRGHIGWMLTTNPPPWTRITAWELHPAAPNASSIPAEWAVRRWTSSFHGTVRISGSIAKSSTGGGGTQDGTTGYVLVNGTPIYTRPVAANDTSGYDFALETPLSAGDVVDFAVSPNGNDLVDATVFRVTIAAAEPPARWVAFNDHYASVNTHSNATTWNVFTNTAGAPGYSGLLKDIATGAALPVTLAITNYRASGGSSAGEPDGGTMGYSVFHGLIDFGLTSPGTNHSILTSASNNAVVAFVFSGLTPTNEYSFRGIAVRGEPLYTNRWALCEITNAVSFVAAHTTGVLTHTQVPALNEAQAALNSGDNTAGEVVGWDRIRPGTNGNFTVLCRQYTGAVPGGSTGGAPYAYAFSAIRLSEYPPARAPLITDIARDGTLFRFGFATESNRSYVVEYQPELQASPWQILTNISATGSPAVVTDLNPGPQRFYRVRVE